MIEYSIGVDLGGTHIKFVAAKSNGEELARAHDTTDDDGDAAESWRQKIKSQIENWTQEFGAPQSVGLSAPGLASRDERSISFMPGRLQGLENFDWTKQLGVSVRVLNDAHAALLGEVWQGAARQKSDVFMLTLGTGVGGAILSGGKLLRGAIGRAGHLGHISLNSNGAKDIVNTPGSLEDAIGDCTVSQRSGGRFSSTRDLVEAHQKGDADATKIWFESVKNLAAAIAGLINVLDPQAVVLGGGIAQSGDALFHPLREYLSEWEWRPGGHTVEILPAQLGDFAGALGAAFYSRNEHV